MGARKVLVAIFDAKADVEEAVSRLSAAEVTLDSVSVVGRSHHVDEQVGGTFRTPSGLTRYFGRDEGFWNRLWELLPGAAFLWVPGVGTLVFAGTLAAAVIEHARQDSPGDAGNALRSALLGLGVPDDFGSTCESALRGDRVLFVVRTPVFQAARTYALLEQSRALEARAYLEPRLADGEPEIKRRRRGAAVG